MADPSENEDVGLYPPLTPEQLDSLRRELRGLGRRIAAIGEIIAWGLPPLSDEEAERRDCLEIEESLERAFREGLRGETREPKEPEPEKERAEADETTKRANRLFPPRPEDRRPGGSAEPRGRGWWT